MTAPTVIPNIATEIAIKAKWYHMLTLNTLVSTNSYIKVTRAQEEDAQVSAACGSEGGGTVGATCQAFLGIV